MAAENRLYSAGIQTFSEIIRRGCVYVDKTDLMWKAQQLSKYIFLNRPRRFGKSLLSTTFASFFRAEKELFAGLKVMELEKDWIEYPVIQLDLSVAKGKDTADELRRYRLFPDRPYRSHATDIPSDRHCLFYHRTPQACRSASRVH